MTTSIHQPVRVEAHRHTHAPKEGWLSLFDDHGNKVAVHMPMRVAEAMAAAWQEATEAEERGEAAALRARQMNAELPQADHDMLKTKGMIA